MSTTTHDDALAPVAPGERIHTLDVLRGFALLGIALVNVEFFTRPLQDINADGIDPTTRGFDYLAEWLTYFFVQGKLWTMFALLFGMGFTVMIERAHRAGRPFVPAYLRRSLALLGIGVVHSVLVWSGDILVSYAIGALLLLLARQVRRAWRRRASGRTVEPMSASRMGGWGMALYGLPLVVVLLAGLFDSPPTSTVPSDAQAEHAQRLSGKAVQRANAVAAYSDGTFAQAVDQRIVDTVWQAGTLPIATFWVVGLFLIGGALLRSGVMANPRAHERRLRVMRNAGLPLGFFAMAVSTWLGTASPDEQLGFREAVQVVLFLVASLVLALAYGATLMLALWGPAGRWLQHWLAPAGRMALSNYLMQSVIGTLVFYGYGGAGRPRLAGHWRAGGVRIAGARQPLVAGEVPLRSGGMGMALHHLLAPRSDPRLARPGQCAVPGLANAARVRLPPSKLLTMEQHDDVVIAGAGVIGLASALALIESGRRVRVIDAGHVGGGSSHGNCGTITPSHAPPLAAPGTLLKALKWMLTPDAPLYIPPRFDPALWGWLMRFAARCNTRDWRASARAKSALLNDSRARLADWVRGYGLACEFVESGEDYVFRDPRGFEHGHRELDLLRELGISVEVIDGARYEALEPALKPGVAGAIRFDGDAALRPDRYVDELARAVRERGGTIVEQCALQGIEHDRSGVRVRTAQGELRARDAVLALGAWSPRLADAVGLPFLKQAMQPGKGYSITYSSPTLVPKRPLVLRDRSVCVTAWGSGFRLGSTMEFSGFDDTLNARRLGALERGAREYLHEPFGAERQEQWYGWRPMSCDDIPIIGAVPNRSGVWLATGHGMMGVGMSAGTGQLVADLIAGRTPAIDPTPYRMERFL